MVWLPAAVQAASGNLDLTFGNGGIVITPITNSPYYDSPSSMQVQPDGKIVVCGQILEDDFYGDTYTASFFLARYNSTGTLDDSFGTNGKVLAPFGVGSEFVGQDITLQPDGKIIAVGYKWNSYTSYDFAVNRYNPNGTLDTSFGTGGRVVTPVGSNFEYAATVALQSDGKILAFGRTLAPGDDAIVTIRYLGDSAVSRPTKFDFDGDGKADLSVFRPSDRVWYLNKSTDGFSAAQFGLSTDKITPADYDGDGKMDVAVFRSSTGVGWLLRSANGLTTTQFGQSGDTPVPASYLP